jgi:PhnB protein
MRNLHAYLTFDGNCREAMHFYHDCLRGELSLQTVGETPMADRLPGNMRQCILHATLTSDQLLLMGSDMVDDAGLIRGNSVSLMLNCSTEEDLHRCYQALSSGGRCSHPIEHTFWGAMLGGLTDKFGHHWLLHYHPGPAGQKTPDRAKPSTTIQPIE